MPQPRGEPGRAGEGSGVPGLHLPGSPRQPSSDQATSDQAGHSADSGSPAARPAAGRRPRPPPPARLRRQRQEEQQEQQQPVPLQPSPPPREQQQQQPQQQQEPSPLLPRTAPTPATAALATFAAAEEQQEQQAGPRKRQRRAAAPRRGMFAAMAAGVEHEQLDGASEEEGDEGEEDEEEDEGGGSFRGPAGRGRGVRQAKRRAVAPRTRLPAQGAPSGAAGGSTSLHQEPGAATNICATAAAQRKRSLYKGTTDVYEGKLKLFHYFVNYMPGQDPNHCWIDLDEQGTELGDLEKGPLLAAAFLRWVGAGAPGFFRDAQEIYKTRFSLERMNWKYTEGVHSALQRLFTERRKALAPGAAIEEKKLLSFSHYLDVHSALKSTLHGDKDTVDIEGPDPQQGTAADTYTFEQYRSAMRKLMLSPFLTAQREGSNFTFMHGSVGRSDDVRLMRICSFLTILLDCIGPAPFWVISGVLMKGKTQKDGAKGYKGVSRNVDPVVCPFRALGFYFWARFVSGGEPFPDPTSREDWRTRYMWANSVNPKQSVKYAEQNKAVHELFDGLSEMASVVHAFRKGGTRQLQDSGLSPEVIAQLGMWLVSALVRSYMHSFPPDAMLALAGFKTAAAKKDFHLYWHERFTLCVPSCLQGHLFPFLPKLREQVNKMSSKERRNEVSVTRVLKMLEVLAVTTVQDLLWMAVLAQETKEDAVYLQMPIMQYMMEHEDFRQHVRTVKLAKEIGFWVGKKPMSERELLGVLIGLLADPKPVAKFLCGADFATEFQAKQVDLEDLRRRQDDALDDLRRCAQADPEPEASPEPEAEVESDAQAAVLAALSPNRAASTRLLPSIIPRVLDMDVAAQEPSSAPGTAPLGAQQHHALLPQLQQVQQPQREPLPAPQQALQQNVPPTAQRPAPQTAQQHVQELQAPLPAQVLAQERHAQHQAPPQRQAPQQPQMQQQQPQMQQQQPQMQQQQAQMRQQFRFAPQAVPSHPVVQLMGQQVPLAQQFLPPIGEAAQQLPTSFLMEQTLSMAAPFQHVIGGGGYGVLSNTPAIAHYQPMLVHQIGPAAATQQFLMARQQQQTLALQQQQQHMFSNLLLPTSADGTILATTGPQLGWASQAVAPGAAGGADGEHQGSGKGGKGRQGSRQLLKPRQSGMPPLSAFKANGGLTAIWTWYTEEFVPPYNMTRRQLEEEQLRLRPYEEPEWRANTIDKRRFSEVKLLCAHIEACALEKQRTTGRVWSRPEMARQLETQRRTAGKGGKEQGLASLVKQLQKQRKIPAASEEESGKS